MYLWNVRPTFAGNTDASVENGFVADAYITGDASDARGRSTPVDDIGQRRRHQYHNIKNVYYNAVPEVHA